MLSTSVSLLDRLRDGTDPLAWERFARMYTPILAIWSRRLGLQPDDANDLVQDVFVLLMRKLSLYRRDGSARFRDWLRTVLTNRFRESRRRIQPTAAGDLGEVVVWIESNDPAADFWAREYRTLVVAKAMDVIRRDFEETTWRAFLATTAEGRRAADVAAELGMTEAAVYAGKARILARLRREFADILD